MLRRRRDHHDRRIIFAFAGGSGAWPGMGRALYAAEPVFRSSVDECDRIACELGLRDQFGISLTDAFRDGTLPPESDVREARWFELICLGVIQVALCDLWAAVGVTPDATLSVSLSEMTAPYAAGALTREDVVAVLYAVNRVCTRVMLDGSMFNVSTGSRSARDLCRSAPRPLIFLGTIGPSRSMLYSAGDDADVNRTFLEASGLLSKRLPTGFPYHTMLSAFDLSSLERALGSVHPHDPRIPIFSSVAGRDIAPDAVFDATYWHWMIRQAFWYAEATAAALEDGPAVIVNIGAAPVTTPWILETTRALEITPVFVDSMRPDQELEAWAQAREALGLRPSRWRTGSRTGPRTASPTAPPTAPRAAQPARDLAASEMNGAGPDVDPAAVDLGAPDTVRDPFRILEGLRQAGPVHYLDRHDAWLVVAHAEVSEAFGRSGDFSSRLLAVVDPIVLGTDPPEHTPARRELSARFAPPALADLAVMVSETADKLLDGLMSADEFDVLGEFAAPLGDGVAGRMLGLDDEQLAQVRRTIGDPERDPQELFGAIDRAFAEVFADPQPVHRLLWVASTTTTKRLITAAVLLLLEHPALRERIVSDPGLLPGLIDETVRLHPPERMVGRITTGEADLGGVRIPAGSIVQLCLAAANRDPERFPDPDRVDLDRRGAHLAFGGGPHRCPGSRLARIETETAIAALLERMPGFRAVQPACALRWIPSSTTHGLEELIIAPSGYIAED